MKVFNNQLTINNRIAGTGWLPPRPDLRDYSEEHEKISEIFTVAQGAGRRAQSKDLYPAASTQQQASSTQHPAPIAGIVDLREWCSPVEDQGAIGSCTAHAAAGIVEYYERKAFGKHLEASRLFLYKTTRNLMQTTGDTGGWIRCTMGALVLCGLPDEKYWPYDVAKFDKEPTAFVYSVANNYQAVKYFRHDVGSAERRAQGSGESLEGEAGSVKRKAESVKKNQDQGLTPEPSIQQQATSTQQQAPVLTSVKKYLDSGIPSMFGFWGFGSFDKSDVKGGIPYPADNEAAQWGHAVAAFGYDDKKKIKNLVNNKTTTGALLIRNSWGKDWGEDGYGWLPYEYVLNGFVEDFWSMISMEWVETGQFGI